MSTLTRAEAIALAGGKNPQLANSRRPCSTSGADQGHTWWGARAVALALSLTDLSTTTALGARSAKVAPLHTTMLAPMAACARSCRCLQGRACGCPARRRSSAGSGARCSKSRLRELTKHPERAAT